MHQVLDVSCCGTPGTCDQEFYTLHVCSELFPNLGMLSAFGGVIQQDVHTHPMHYVSEHNQSNRPTGLDVSDTLFQCPEFSGADNRFRQRVICSPPPTQVSWYDDARSPTLPRQSTRSRYDSCEPTMDWPAVFSLT